MFHGTSNCSEHWLDLGNSKPFAHFTQQECINIHRIYHKIDWCGKGGGYPVLSSFSLADNATDAEKYFFLSENPKQCLLYASQDYAGGEFVRALFYSILHLKEYLKNEALRAEHKEYVELEFMYTRKAYHVNLDELEMEVKNLDSIFQRVSEIRDQYRYGILYCYEINPTEYKKLLYRGGMGIIAMEQLNSESLVAKIIYDDIVDAHVFETDIPRLLLWAKRLKPEMKEI